MPILRTVFGTLAAVAGAGLVILAIGGCQTPPPSASSESPRGEKRSEAPDVLLVTIDTLRADRVGIYGSTTARTPQIDRLAEEGAWFANAVAPLPETRPSHFTIFTSLYPRDHGVVSNTQALDGALPTLAEVYAAAGYRTAAFLGTILLDEDSGAGRGFEFLSAGTEPQRPATEVLAEVEAYLSTAPAEEPLFLWVHLFDPHMPYEPAAGVQGEDPRWTEELPSFAWPQLLSLARAHGGDLPAGAVERGRELYAGEVEATDAAFGRLRTLQENRGRWDETVALLTADHGECFERGIYFEHSHCLGEGALSVPLVIAGPGITPKRHDVIVEHLDIAPTLLAATGLDAPSEFAGRDVLGAPPPAADAIAFFHPPIYPQEQLENRQDVLRRFRSAGGDPTRELLGDRVQVGARQGRFKYLRVGDSESLYDLQDDPTESRNLAADLEEVVRRLRRASREWLRDHPIRPLDSLEINPELEKRLEALGYL